MALATPTIAVQDGAAAAVNVAAGATGFATPGNFVTITLQSTSGVQYATYTLSGSGTNLDNRTSGPIISSPFSFTFQIPIGSEGAVILTTEVSDGQNVTTNQNVINFVTRWTGNNLHRARFVSAANNESLTAFVGVTGGTARDGINGVQGDYVLLAGQTSKSQNGLYVIGVVAAGTAPLTRVPDFATGLVLPAGQECTISEGTLFANTRWFISTSGSITVDTTNHDWMPECVTQSVTLVAGTVTVANVPVLSATRTGISSIRTTANTSTATTGGYHVIGGITPGAVGTATFNFQATVAAGTINNADVSTLNLTILNR